MRSRMTRGANMGSSTGRVALSSRASPSRTAAECVKRRRAKSNYSLCSVPRRSGRGQARRMGTPVDFVLHWRGIARDLLNPGAHNWQTSNVAVLRYS